MAPVEDQLQSLYRKLRRLHVLGLIETEAYTLGMHLLAQMAKAGSLSVATSARPFTQTYVAAGHEPIVGPLTSQPFLFLGALQQLHEYVGLRSHYSEDALRGEGSGAHFSRKPAGPGNVPGLDHPLYFLYEPITEFTEKAMMEALASKNKKVRLPAWFKSTQFKV